MDHNYGQRLAWRDSLIVLGELKWRVGIIKRKNISLQKEEERLSRDPFRMTGKTQYDDQFEKDRYEQARMEQHENYYLYS